MPDRCDTVARLSVAPIVGKEGARPSGLHVTLPTVSTSMSRRTAAAPDRHALLTGHAYPSSSSVRVASPAVTEYNTPLRTASPYENPYGDMQGAPKKEASSSSGFVSLFQGTAAQQRSAADLEEQNDTRLNALSERIKMLKDVCPSAHQDLDGDRKRSARVYKRDELVGA